jgi:hypothetical protein
MTKPWSRMDISEGRVKLNAHYGQYPPLDGPMPEHEFW